MNKFRTFLLVSSIFLLVSSLVYNYISAYIYKQAFNPFGYEYSLSLNTKGSTADHLKIKEQLSDFVIANDLSIFAFDDRVGSKDENIYIVNGSVDDGGYESDGRKVRWLGRALEADVLKFKDLKQPIFQVSFYAKDDRSFNLFDKWVSDHGMYLVKREQGEDSFFDWFGSDSSLLLLLSGIYFIVAFYCMMIASLRGVANFFFNGNGFFTLLNYMNRTLLKECLVSYLCSLTIIIVYSIIKYGISFFFLMLNNIFIPTIIALLVINTALFIFGVFGMTLLSISMRELEVITIYRRIIYILQGAIILIIIFGSVNFYYIEQFRIDNERKQWVWDSKPYGVVTNPLPIAAAPADWNVSPFNEFNLKGQALIQELESEHIIGYGHHMQIREAFWMGRAYDGVAVVNSQYLKDTGFMQNGIISSLNPISYHDIDSDVRDKIENYVEGLGIGNNYDVSKMKYYTLNNNEFVIEEGFGFLRTREYKNPLIILNDEISYTFRTDGLLGSSLNTGGMYLIDIDKAKQIIAKHYPGFSGDIMPISKVLIDDKLELDKQINQYSFFMSIAVLIFLFCLFIYVVLTIDLNKDRYMLSVYNGLSILSIIINIGIKILIANSLVSIIAYYLSYTVLPSFYFEPPHALLVFFIQFLLVIIVSYLASIYFLSSERGVYDLFE